MKPIRIALALAVCCASYVTALAQPANVSKADEYSPFAPINRTVTDVREVLKMKARMEQDRAMREATSHPWRWTSKDRKGRLASPAHDRGATDFAPRSRRDVDYEDYDSAAIGAVRRLGEHYKAIVERPSVGFDWQTSYIQLPNGTIRKNGPYIVEPGRATGDHIHIQPDRSITIPRAARPAEPTVPRATPGESSLQLKRLPQPFVGPPAPTPAFTPRVAPPVLSPGTPPSRPRTTPQPPRRAPAKDNPCSRNASKAC